MPNRPTIRIIDSGNHLCCWSSGVGADARCESTDQNCRSPRRGQSQPTSQFTFLPEVSNVVPSKPHHRKFRFRNFAYRFRRLGAVRIAKFNAAKFIATKLSTTPSLPAPSHHLFRSPSASVHPFSVHPAPVHLTLFRRCRPRMRHPEPLPFLIKTGSPSKRSNRPRRRKSPRQKPMKMFGQSTTLIPPSLSTIRFSTASWHVTSERIDTV